MKVSQHRDRLTRAGATAVFVVHDQPELLRRTMLAGVTSPFPVVVDMDRTSYRAWGLRRTSAVRIWLDPNVWLQYAHLLRSGERLRQMGRDTRQLGGDFIVDAAGRIAYSRPQHRDDRPPVGRLLQRLEQVTR